MQKTLADKQREELEVAQQVAKNVGVQRGMFYMASLFNLWISILLIQTWGLWGWLAVIGTVGFSMVVCLAVTNYRFNSYKSQLEAYHAKEQEEAHDASFN